MPIVLSKCKLPPRTFDMTDADYDAYFNAINNPTVKKVLLDKINHCTGVVGESILDSTAKKAWHGEHTKDRPSLLEQARMLRECVLVVKNIVKPTQIEAQRKVELAKFQLAVRPLAVATESTENIIFVIYLRSMVTIGRFWRAWDKRIRKTIINGYGCWITCF